MKSLLKLLSVTINPLFSKYLKCFVQISFVFPITLFVLWSNQNLVAQTTFYSQDFETTNDWTFNQPGYSNKANFWIWGSGTAGATSGAATNTGTGSMQIWRYTTSGGGGFVSDYFGTSTSGYTRIIEKEFDLTSISVGSTVTFSYYVLVVGESGWDDFRLYDATASVVLDGPAQYATWTKREIDISQYAGSTVLLQFQWRNDGGIEYQPGARIDDIEITYSAPCNAPTNLASSSVTASSATISWTASTSSPSGGYDYYYSTSSTAPTSGTTPSGSVGAVATSANLTSLSPGTTYYYWVRSDCGFNGPWTSSANFTTLCTAAAPWTENFDGTSLPSCWSQSATTGGPWVFSSSFTWNTSGCASTPSDNTGNGGSFARLDFSNNTGADVGVILQTPDIDISSLSTPYLKFSFWMCGSGYSPLNELYVEAYNGSSWDQIALIQEGSASWVTYGYDVSAYVYNSSYVTIRFRAEDGGSGSMFYGDMAIDDVQVIESPPSITVTASLSTFSGCDGTAGSSQTFQVEGVNIVDNITIAAPTDYEVSTDNSSFADNVVIGAPGTVASTDIYIRMKSTASGSPSGNVVCSSTNASSKNVAASGTVNENPVADAGSDVSLCSGNSSVLSGSGSMTAPAIPSGYAASYATSISDTYISNVTFNSISTTTGANTGSVETDNTGTVITVDKGSAYTLSITTSDDGGTAYSHGIAAFIDWNRDGDFADANETVYTTSSEVNIGTVSTSVTVPAGAEEGDMMMRVVADEDASAPSATGTYTFGETEKYTIRVNPTLTYSWSPITDLDNSAIAEPTTSTISTRTYTLTVTAGNGCTDSDDVISTVDEIPTVVGSSSVTDATTCGEIQISVAVESNGATGEWNNTGIGSFASTADASTDFTSNTFNQDMTLTWTNNSGACSGSTATITAKFNQPSPTGSMDGDSWVWGGLTNSTSSEPTNWYYWDGSKWMKSGGSTGYATPDVGSKIYVLPTSDICVSNNLTNTQNSIGDLNIQGGSFDLGSSNTTITGNITNDGTMFGGTGTVTLNGSSDQTISGSGTINFNNLTVNKDGSSVILSSTTNVGSTLTMTNGNIVNSQPLVIGSSSASPGTLSHKSGIVTGELRRYFANATGSTFFPVGTSSNMRDVTINFTQAPGTDEYLTVSYVAGAPTLSGSDGAYSGLPLTTNDNQLIQNYSADGHWNIDPTGGLYESTEINSAAYEITLHCKALSVQPTDVSKVRIIKSAGSENGSLNHVSWTGLDLLSSSGTGADFTVTAAATGFSKFGAGSEDGNPLPVELVSFSGACNDGLVELIWETASEYNSSHFDVENSRDGITWDVVKTIEAAGFSNELITYGYNDFHANGSDNYYRLTQVDIDGTSKTYDVINVSCSQTTSGYFSIFPNPSSGSFQVMLNNSDIVGSAEMNIVDTKGNKVMMKSIDVKTGINMFAIDENLAPGIYYVSVKNGVKTTPVLKLSIK